MQSDRLEGHLSTRLCGKADWGPAPPYEEGGHDEETDPGTGGGMATQGLRVRSGVITSHISVCSHGF